MYESCYISDEFRHVFALECKFSYAKLMIPDRIFHIRNPPLSTTKEKVIDSIVHFYLGLTFVLLLHCVVGAYFLSRGRRISRSLKSACFGSLAVCASLLIIMIFFQMCFSAIIAPVDAALLLTPLIWLLAGDLFMYGQAVRKRYKLADGSRVRERA